MRENFPSAENYSLEILFNLSIAEGGAVNKIFTTDNVDTQVQVFNVFFFLSDLCAPLVTKEVKSPFAA